MANLSTLEMTQQDWLESRRLGIGSSDAGIILGVNKYRSPHQLWLEKTGRVPLADNMNEKMEFGHRMEPVAAEVFAERTERKVINDNKIRIHDKHPFLIANLDRLILPKNGEGRGILEIKNTTSMYRKTWEEAIPLSYYVQLQHQLMVTGLSWGEFGIITDGCSFDHVPFLRDEEFIASMMQAEVAWWTTHVIGDVEPEKTAEEYSFIRSREGARVTANTLILSAVEDALSLKKEIKSLESRLDEAEEIIKVAIGDAQILEDENGTVLATWKNDKDGFRFNGEKLKAENPDVYAKYMESKSGSRRLLLKSTKS